MFESGEFPINKFLEFNKASIMYQLPKLKAVDWRGR